MGGRPRIFAIAIAALLGCGPAHVTAAYAIDAAVIDAAKKEGEVVWYSTQIINQLVRPIAAAFEKKYPGIKVRYTRANANRGGGQDSQRKPGRPAAIGRVRRHLDRGAAEAGGLRAAVAARCRQGLSGSLQGSAGLLGRQQPLHQHAGLQYDARPEGTRAAHLSGPARSEMERQDRLELAAVGLGRGGLHRHRAGRDGRGEGHGLSARLRQAEGRQRGGRGARGARPGDRRRIRASRCRSSTITP